jgi:hypothetical protein
MSSNWSASGYYQRNDGKNVSQLRNIDLPENLSGRAVEFVTMRKGEMPVWKLKESV